MNGCHSKCSGWVTKTITAIIKDKSYALTSLARSDDPSPVSQTTLSLVSGLVLITHISPIKDVHAPSQMVAFVDAAIPNIKSPGDQRLL